MIKKFFKNKIVHIVSLCLALIFLSLIVAFTGSYEVYCFQTQTQKKLPIYSVERIDKKISISFDCAWGTDYTDKLLETMKTYNVKCTFFMVEFWTKKYPDYVKKINDAGHEIGTHSSTHKYMSKLEKEAIVNELKTSSSAIEEITNKKVELFRPPYGDYNDRLISTAREMGLYSIQWDTDSLDWKNLSANEIANRVISKTQSGSIILCHNNGLHTAESLPIIFDKLINDGYSFVPIGELIYRQDYSIDANGRQWKN